MSIASTLSCADVESVEPNAPGAEISKPQVLNATVLNPQTKIDFGGGNYAEEKLQPITLAWAAGDTFSVYEVNGAWVADFEINDLDAATFATVAGGGALVEGSSYIAVYPARPNAEATHAEYAALDLTSSQEADAASLAHFNSSCQMSDEFTLGDDILFEHQKAIMTIQFDDIPAGETPTKVQFSDGVNKNYALQINGLAESTDTADAYDVHMMIDPSEAVVRDLTFTVTHTAGVNVYNVQTGKSKDPVAYEAGCCYQAPIKNQNEQTNLNYWLSIGTADALEAYLNTSASDQFKNTVLTADIDMTGKTVTPAAYMGKVFDGNGYTISNLTITATSEQVGMFKGVNGTGVVKNITLQSPKMTGKAYVGAIAGKMMTGSSIVNCVVKDAVIVATTNNAGGIAGQAQANILGCSFSGSVESQTTTNAGGIVGIAAAGTVIADCTVEADATITTKTTNAGGIVGNATTTTIYNCTVLGAVKATTNVAGGIAGVASTNSIIYSCVNGGTVDGVQKVGGIAGEIPSGGDIVACYNYGEIGTDRTTGSTAGLIGQITSETVATSVIGCYNNNTGGKITNGYVLGYVKATDTVTATDCYYVADAAKGNFGTLLSDITALNAQVDAMNAAINATSYNAYNFVAGVDATIDCPTLIRK